MAEETIVRRRRIRRESRGRQFLRNFRVELLWLLVIAVGLFLLLGGNSLRASVTSWTKQTVHQLLQRATTLDERISAFLAQVSLSDLIGFVLVLVALTAILLRVRWRLLNTPELTQLRCPQCGGGLQRIHRTAIDRFIDLFVPVRRYRCRTDGCGWSGLRTGRGYRTSQNSGVRGRL